MDRDTAYTLAKEMLAHIPDSAFHRFIVQQGKFSIHISFPYHEHVTVESPEQWEDAKAAHDTTEEFIKEAERGHQRSHPIG